MSDLFDRFISSRRLLNSSEIFTLANQVAGLRQDQPHLPHYTSSFAQVFQDPIQLWKRRPNELSLSIFFNDEFVELVFGC